MLVELIVENYAVIERLRVRFHAGLNLLTGETGSGKSIVVDALGLLFGGRASSDMIRGGAGRARISGIFELPESREAQRLLEEAGVELEEQELLIEREVQAGGKSRAFLANRPVTVAWLRELCHLGDIHGQHDQQRLFEATAQREMLDAFAGAQALGEETAAAYQGWRACARELEELSRSEQEKLRLADMWGFQRREIEGARLKPGEDSALEAERSVLQNVARLQEAATEAYAALYEAPESGLAQLKLSLRRLEEICRIDTSLAEARDTLRPAVIAVEESARAIRDYLVRLEADPQRLEQVETRLATFEKLKRKYGSSIEEILVFLDQVRGQLEALETAGERRAEIEKTLARRAAEYEAAAERLSRMRQEAAQKLARRVETELAALAMERTRFEVGLARAGWSESGWDAVEFLVSPNLGEEPRPLDKVASGGEISRLALALKTAIAAASRVKPRGAPRTLVFDEVDAGIGGSAAAAVGKRLQQLAASSQVLCVTHLAQIAGFADHHYAVEKRETQGRTVASIRELDSEERRREIGRMLSGHQITPEALKQADQLIRVGRSPGPRPTPSSA